MNYGNRKITSTHLYPRIWNVAAQVAEELKTVTYLLWRNVGGEKKDKKKVKSSNVGEKKKEKKRSNPVTVCSMQTRPIPLAHT